MYIFFRDRRVHVSSRTLGFLDDQFEVEAAHGEKREQVLRMAGIETFFILRAKNPVISCPIIDSQFRSTPPPTRNSPLAQ